jgi:hypothetical protein
MFFGLLFMACGEVSWEPYSSSGTGGLSSGLQPSSSSSVSSSNSCAPLGNLHSYLNLQAAPGNSYVHGSTQITMDAFYISAHLITQGQYKTIMGENPSKGQKDDALPIEGVNWFKAVEFCKKLSAQMCLDSNAIKLPTEAQWEYAQPVIQRYWDYWEWTNDCYDSDFPLPGPHDPTGPDNCDINFQKVRKGFGRNFDERFSTYPDVDNISGGYISFRVAVKSKYLQF